MLSGEDKKMVTLKSADGVTFEVQESVVEQFRSIKNLYEEDLPGAFIPLPNVSSKILAKVIDYCKRHANENDGNNDLREFDAEFVNIDRETLFDLVLAANYLNVENLLYLTCQTAADMCKRMTPEEIRKLFNIKNEFSPEEEEEAAKYLKVKSLHDLLEKEEEIQRANARTLE